MQSRPSQRSRSEETAVATIHNFDMYNSHAVNSSMKIGVSGVKREKKMR